MKIKVETKVKGMKGSVMLDVPRSKERMLLLKKVNFQAVEGELKGGGQMSAGIELSDLLGQELEKRTSEIELVHVESGVAMASLEELEMYEEGGEVLSELGSALMRGVKLGKNSGPQ